MCRSSPACGYHTAPCALALRSLLALAACGGHSSNLAITAATCAVVFEGVLLAGSSSRRPSLIRS